MQCTNQRMSNGTCHVATSQCSGYAIYEFLHTLWLEIDRLKSGFPLVEAPGNLYVDSISLGEPCAMVRYVCTHGFTYHMAERNNTEVNTVTPVFHGRNSYQEFLALYGCRDFRPGKAVKMKNPSSEKSQLWKVGFFESWGFPDGNSIIELSPLCLLQESGLLNMVILYSSSIRMQDMFIISRSQNESEESTRFCNKFKYDLS